jgi:diaminohydroxyphosphoribosylaminopyrimidine deaminase / 5-amino-6-(5-phosphoribosylamino)uracil reductase
MGQPTGSAAVHPRDKDAAAAAGWNLVQAAARAAERLEQANEFAAFALASDGHLRAVPASDLDALIAWRPGAGWEALLPLDDPRRGLIDLYLPICSATTARPITVGHLGQSLDGFIATQAGESHWITGEQNILHMHRLRALCDAVVVGAGTVAADDPQLTTRLVAGPNPLRVVIDPGRRLGAHYRVFTDDAVETLYVCARSLIRAGERSFGRAAIVGVEGGGDVIDAAELIALLRGRGCARVFVEGGGVTVSMFLAANLLDRLQMAIAPLIIGDGRPAIRLPLPIALGDCLRPRYRVFSMGGDVLFDCDFTASPEGPGKEAAGGSAAGRKSGIARVL